MCYYRCVGCDKNLGNVPPEGNPFPIADVKCFCSEMFHVICVQCRKRTPCTECRCVSCLSNCTKQTYPLPKQRKRHLDW